MAELREAGAVVAELEARLTQARTRIACLNARICVTTRQGFRERWKKEDQEAERAREEEQKKAEVADEGESGDEDDGTSSDSGDGGVEEEGEANGVAEEVPERAGVGELVDGAVVGTGGEVDAAKDVAKEVPERAGVGEMVGEACVCTIAPSQGVILLSGCRRRMKRGSASPRSCAPNTGVALAACVSR